MSWDYVNIKSFRSVKQIKACLLFLYEAITSSTLMLGNTSDTAGRGDYAESSWLHSQEDASTDPHGTIAALRAGVAAQGDTLQKLYNLILSIGQLVGDFSATAGTLPTVGTGIGGTIDKGDMWQIVTDGTLPVGVSPTNIVTVGDTLVARVSNPSTAADFYVIKNTVNQATDTLYGIVKLYVNLLASNTDGTVTQAALVTAFTSITNALAAKQATLESGVNIKTFGGESIIGSGDLSVGGTVADASASTKGIAKLYTDLLASNTDGSVTQAVVVNAINTIIAGTASYTPGSNALGKLKSYLGLSGTNSGTRDTNSSWVIKFTGSLVGGVTQHTGRRLKVLSTGEIIYCNTSPTALYKISADGDILLTKNKISSYPDLWHGIMQTADDNIIMPVVSGASTYGVHQITNDFVIEAGFNDAINGTSIRAYAEDDNGYYYVSSANTINSGAIEKRNKATGAFVWGRGCELTVCDVREIKVTSAGYVFVYVTRLSSGISYVYILTPDGTLCSKVELVNGQFVLPVTASSSGEFWCSYPTSFTIGHFGKFSSDGTLIKGFSITNGTSAAINFVADDLDGNYYVIINMGSVNYLRKYNSVHAQMWTKSINMSGIAVSLAVATPQKLIIASTYDLLINIPSSGNIPLGTYSGLTFGAGVSTDLVGATFAINVTTTVTLTTPPATIFSPVARLATQLSDATPQSTLSFVLYPLTYSMFANFLAAAVAKTTLVAADSVGIRDSVTGLFQQITLTNFAASIFNMGGTLGAALDCNDKLVSNARLKSCSISQYDFGTVNSTSAINVNVGTNGNLQTLTCGGNITLTVSFTNWPVAGFLGYTELLLTNMGLGTLVFADTINWKLKDDSYTTNFATYLADRGGQAVLKTSGLDRFMFEYFNSAIYGTLI